MSAVWKHSKAKGGDLLVLLAIADFADDDGVAYPAVGTLGKKSRMSGRNVQFALKRLQKRDELSLSYGQGPRGTNLYRVKCFQGENSSGMKNSAGGGEKSCMRGVKPASSNPSEETVMNHHRSTGGAFDLFWTQYPRKKAKQRAKRAWTKLKPNEQLQGRILDALERAKTSADWTKDAGAYIPYPATWLNDGGWEDEEMSLGTRPCASTCAEKVSNANGRGFDPCGKPIDRDQPDPRLPFCAAHLPRRRQLRAQLEGRS